MTGKTWSDQVSRVVVIERTPTTEMMSLQFTRSSTILAFSAHFAGDAPVPRAIARNDSTLRVHSSTEVECWYRFTKFRAGVMFILRRILIMVALSFQPCGQRY